MNWIDAVEPLLVAVYEVHVLCWSKRSRTSHPHSRSISPAAWPTLSNTLPVAQPYLQLSWHHLWVLSQVLAVVHGGGSPRSR
ncbi:hypothetical protein TorRG33x02_279800 [Trema orientale]|uniref:Uncharacterized protein n=1 Tax=Trema orientale TaxID=63057 RepID=A0A2P5CMG3_TREOI|nr:hypothetical protein TorRG33x02_279800 [Trema orientale]